MIKLLSYFSIRILYQISYYRLDLVNCVDSAFMIFESSDSGDSGDYDNSGKSGDCCQSVGPGPRGDCKRPYFPFYRVTRRYRSDVGY